MTKSLLMVFAGVQEILSVCHRYSCLLYTSREAGSVPLKQQDDGTETENQDDELDETLTGMDYIPYTQQNACLLYTSRCV